MILQLITTTIFFELVLVSGDADDIIQLKAYIYRVECGLT